MDIRNQKNKENLRQEITLKKKQFTPEQLEFLSQEVMMTLEITGVFVDAKNILIYYNLPDEVATIDFIEKWSKEKTFFLPVVKGDDLVFRKYVSGISFQSSKLGVDEPIGDDLVDYKKIDLVVVPGVAFDRAKNRIGRGKGYYDRFLKKISAPKIGICFDFQLLDKIPVSDNDVKMDYIVSENDLIW